MARAVLILTGVEPEAAVLARALSLPRLSDHGFPAYGRGATRLAATGLGARRLAERLPKLADGLASPLIVSAGLCGGLAPDLKAGDLVVPQAALDGEGHCYVVSESLPGQERRGMIATAGAVVATPEAKAKLLARTGAMAVDMESAAILAAAKDRNWPALVVRAVSDTASERLPEDLLGLVDTDGRMRRARTVRTFLGHPSLLPAAFALQRTSARALAALADALRPLLA